MWRPVALACLVLLICLGVGTGAYQATNEGEVSTAVRAPVACDGEANQGAMSEDIRRRDSVWMNRLDGDNVVRIGDTANVSGGHALVGSQWGPRDPIEGFLLRINESGNVAGGYEFSDNGTVPYAVRSTSTGDFVVAGKQNVRSIHNVGTTWMAAFDSDGNCEWDATFGGGTVREVIAVDDGWLLLGKSGRHDSLAMQVSSDGRLDWRRTYSGNTLTDGIVLNDGTGFLVTSSDGRLYRLDRTGHVQWEESVVDGAHIHAIQARSNGYLLGADDARVIALNRTGHVENTTQISDFDGADVTALRRFQGSLIVGSENGIARLAVDDVGIPTGVDHVTTTVLNQKLGTVRDLRTVHNGHVLVAGTIPGEYVEHNRDGYVSRVDQQPPTVDVSVDDQTPEVGTQQVQLTAEVEDNGAIRTYHWDFDGDGERDRRTTEPSVTHVYDNTSAINTTVRAIDFGGNVGQATVRVQPQDTTPPVAVLSAPDPRFVATTAPARLDAEGSHDNLGIRSYQWDLDGDGDVDRITNRSHIKYQFEDPGEHRIRLVVVDESGLRNESIYRLQTAENTGSPNVTVTSSTAVLNRSTTFRANVTDRVGTPTVTWAFPNGSQATGQTATYVFRENGTHTVRVVAEDEYGSRSVQNVSVTVHTHRPHPSSGVGWGMIAVMVTLAKVLLSLIVVLLVGTALVVAVVRR